MFSLQCLVSLTDDFAIFGVFIFVKQKQQVGAGGRAGTGTNKRCFSVVWTKNNWKTITVSADHICSYYPLTCILWKRNNKVAELWLIEFLTVAALRIVMSCFVAILKIVRKIKRFERNFFFLRLAGEGFLAQHFFGNHSLSSIICFSFPPLASLSLSCNH